MLDGHAPKCFNRKPCFRLCATRGCPHNPAVCKDPNCSCIQDHLDCTQLVYWSEIKEQFQKNQERGNSQYVNYVHFCLDELLLQFIHLLQQELVRFREEKLNIGLSKIQKQFFKKLKNNQKLSTGLIADLIQEQQSPNRIMEYPVSQHQHSVKVIKHMIGNLISSFRQAFTLQTVEEDVISNSYNRNKMVESSRIPSSSNKNNRQMDRQGLLIQNKETTTTVNIQDFGSVNSLYLKSCSSSQLKLSSQLFVDLNRLDLQDCGISTSNVKFINGFKKIQYLNLHGNRIKDEGLIEISKQMNQLRALGIRNTGVTDRGIISMASNLQHLQELYLGDNRIGKEGMQMIGKYCQNLTILFLCNNLLGDQTVCSLLSNLKLLQVISLKNNQISNESIRNLVQYHPNLFALYAGQNELTDLSCQYLSKLQNIQTLFLCDNKVTEKGVSLILQHCQMLHFLGIRNNDIQVEKTKELAQFEKCKVII